LRAVLLRVYLLGGNPRL